MELKKGIKISLVGIVFESVGLVLDFFHHLDIGIHTAEGLLTFNHFTIFAGFFINLVGFLLTIKLRTNQGA